MGHLEDAWSDLHDAKPPGWFVGRPTYIEGRGVWEQYAFDPSERAQVGVRSREWTAVAQSEVEVIRELARCLREIRAYGVTTCFRTDAPEGECLRRGTRLPNDTRVLLAKGRAAMGRLLLPLIGYGGTIQFDGWCAAAHWAADDGPGIFSIVLAAYDQNGHSIFAIVSPGHYERGECRIDVYQGPGRSRSSDYRPAAASWPGAFG